MQFEKIFSDETIEHVFILVIGIAIIWICIRLIRRVLFNKIKDNDSRYHAKKFSSSIGYFLTIGLILFIFSDKLGKFSVALGLAGAGIAFALQEVIASFAGWVAILFGRFYKTGERIQLGGIKGDVMDIGVLRTTIMEIGQWVDGDLYNGRIVFIANSFVFKGPVFNYSGDFPYLWDEIKIPIQYGADYEKVKEILLKIGNDVVGKFSEDSQVQWSYLQFKYRLETAQTIPMVSLIANENWVEFTLRYVVIYNMRRSTKSEIFTRVLKEIDETNGAIKFASTAPVFNIDLNKNNDS